METRMTKGMTVQMISMVVFSWNRAGTAPLDLRKATME